MNQQVSVLSTSHIVGGVSRRSSHRGRGKQKELGVALVSPPRNHMRILPSRLPVDQVVAKRADLLGFWRCCGYNLWVMGSPGVSHLTVKLGLRRLQGAGILQLDSATTYPAHAVARRNRPLSGFSWKRNKWGLGRLVGEVQESYSY